MSKLSAIILLSAAVTLTGCYHRSYHGYLAEVDSLISHIQRDSAYHLFCQIDPDNVSREADRMYYDALKVELSQNVIVGDSLFFTIGRDSLLQRCLDYYQRKGDVRNLLRCNLNKGKILSKKQHRHIEATGYLKKAEELLPMAHDIKLAYQTYEALATLNYFSGNTDLAMDYSYLTLGCAERSGNSHMMTYACNHLVVLYILRHEKDSITKYIERSMSLLNQMPPYDRALALANLATSFFGFNQTDSAEVYYKKTLTEMPLSFIYLRMAELSYLKGNKAEADSLWGMALKDNSLSNQVGIYEAIVSRKYDGGDYEATAEAAVKLLELKDSLVKQQQTTEVKAIQMKYDKVVERRKLDRFMIWALVVALLLIAVIAGVVIYHIRKTNRAKEKMMRDQVLINDYHRQIEQLERSGKDATKDINALKRKMQSLQKEQTEQLFEGHALYQQTKANEPVITWSKENFLQFIEYYKVVNLPFILQMESDYSNLTHSNRFFLILQDMGKTDEEITRILGVSDGALRTARSRLRAKRNGGDTKKP